MQMQFAPLYPYLYQTLKPLFPGCLWSGCEQTKTVALTFDDGPHPTYTPQLLKVLDSYKIRASFFLLGACVKRSPEIAQAISANNHWIGLHGYHHENFPQLSPTQLKTTLENTQFEIASACGLSPSSLRDVRPPNGFFTPKTLSLLQAWNYRSVMWSVVPEDWVAPGVSVVTQRVMQQVHNGAVIVLHDGYHGGANVAKTVDHLIPQLLEQGYEFVTIDDFWQIRSTKR